MLVAHNARFDVGFLQRALGAIDGRRLELPVLDTVALARRLLAGREAALRPRTRSPIASRCPTRPVPPCAARRPGDRRAAAAPDRDRAGARGAHRRGRARSRRRRRRGPRRPAGATPRGCRPGPGVYILRDAHGQALYVGKAGDLRRPRALVLRLAAAEAGARGGARRARPRRLRAARQRARGRARRARADPRLAASGELPAAPVPSAGATCGSASAIRCRRSRCATLRRNDGALYAGPAGVAADGRDRARGPARRVRAAHLPPEGAGRRGHVPAGPARTLPRAVSRQRRERGLRGRGRGGSSATSRAAARAGASRCARGSRSSWPSGASRRRRAGSATSPRSTASTPRSRRCGARGPAAGVLLASDIDPGLVRCLAVRGGRALGWRSLPRRGDPSSAIGSVLHELARPPDAVRATGRPARGCPPTRPRRPRS